MKDQDFTTKVVVKQSSEEVFNSINNVRGWWSEEVQGKTDELHAEFFYHYKDVHLAKMIIVEMIPNKKIVWFVKDNYFNFVDDQTEWKGTKISFEIAKSGDKTKLTFTHHGLVQAYDCYEVCSNAWTSYILGSLKNLITTGKGNPNIKGEEMNSEIVEKWKLPDK